MKHSNRFFNLLILLALLTVTLGLSATSALAEEEAGAFVCLPTCDTTDGRMFTISGVGFKTLAGQTTFIKIAAPASMATFQLGVFDGDTSGRWDRGTIQLVYTLFADPDGSQTGTVQLGQWTGAAMTDNDWTDITVEQDTRAQAPSGDYFYYLRIELPDASATTTVSSFKIRSNSPLELATNKSFGYMIPMFSLADAGTLYPAWPALSPTTYDGTWVMYLNVPASQTSFAIWDGDMDFGSYDCSVNDTDDPDTPNDALPPFATGISDRLEGVATTTTLCRDANNQIITGPGGQIYTTGAPTDDARAASYRREPAVTYDVIDPNGNVFHNANPSGDSEWEQFLITTDRSVLADHYVDNLLPAGVYQVRITGLDISNLNAWHLPYDSVGVYEDGTPSVPVLKPFKIGDTIWNDANGNGIQDEGEAGLAGVTVTLLDANGIPNGTAVTDENGQYSFGVTAGDYSVQVDSGNFAPGGALAGFASTTGGELLTHTVTNDNVLTYDFGYQPPALVCTPNNTYKVENTTKRPFYSVKFEFTSGAEVKNGGSDTFKYTLPKSVVESMTSMQVEAKAARVSRTFNLACDFTSPQSCGPVGDDQYAFTFNGATDTGDGNYILSFTVVVHGNRGLSHVSFGLPQGQKAGDVTKSYTSEVCTLP